MITEKRHFEIEHVIIRSRDIRTIASVIERTIDDISKQTEKPRFLKKFSAECEDETAYESPSIEIFEEKGIIDQKQIKRITALVNEFTSDFSLLLNIERSEYGSSRIVVSGNDSKLVNGTLRELENALNDCERQFTFFERYFYFLALPVGFLSVLTFFYLILKVQQHTGFQFISTSTSSSSDETNMVGGLIGAIVASIFPGIAIMSYVTSLWPSVELRTGPDYNQWLVKRRVIIGTIFSLLVLPILFELIF